MNYFKGMFMLQLTSHKQKTFKHLYAETTTRNSKELKAASVRGATK